MENNTIYKRDRRKSYKGKVAMNMSLTEIMEMPDEFIQSFLAAYAEDIERTGWFPIITSKTCRADIEQDIRFFECPEGEERLWVSAAKSLKLAKEKLLNFITTDNIGKVEKNLRDMFGITLEEYNYIKTQPCYMYGLSTLMDIQMMREFGVKVVSNDTLIKFYKKHLGENLDDWATIFTNAKFRKFGHIRRYVPASAKYNTPALFITRSF